MLKEIDENGILEIDLSIISNNFLTIKKALKKKVIPAAVVKANAYGLGMEPICEILYRNGCSVFFVANMLEGKNLRILLNKYKETNDTKIFVLNGPTEKNLYTYIDYNLIPVLNSIYQLSKWKEYVSSNNYETNVAIHFDSGMNRLGFNKKEINQIKSNKDYLKKLNISLLMSHLSSAEEKNNIENYKQKEYFDKVIKYFPNCPASLANSAATILNPDFHYNMVRTGIILYAGDNSLQNSLKLYNSISLKTHIIHINEININQSVGYGKTFRAKRKTLLGTIPIGYADGYPRNFSNAGFAYISDVKVPVIGRVSMDLTILDITDTKAHIGSEVILIGERINIDDIASKGDTISYEILTRLGPRYRRIYKK